MQSFFRNPIVAAWLHAIAGSFQSPTVAAWVQAVAAVFSFLVTLILARLTWVYVKHTRRMADQMVEQGQPVVIGRIEPYGQLYAQYVLSNVGLGPALNLHLRLTLDHESVWRDSLLEPGKSEYFFLPVDGGTQNSSFELLGKSAKKMTATVTYEDRGGRKFEIPETVVDFRQLNADWDHAHWQIRDPELEKHAEELTASIDKLTAEAHSIAESLKKDLAPLTTPTGLSLSVTALRNLRHILSGTDTIERFSPLVRDVEIFTEILGVDRALALRIWNYFRHGGGNRLEDIEGVTPEIGERVRRFFHV